MSDFLYKVIDETTVDITKRLAGIELKPTSLAHSGESGVLRIKATGTYELSVVYYASPSVFQAIASKMKRSPADDPEDIAMYAKEYFNILCGRIVSRINKETKSSARFGIAQYERMEDAPLRDDGEMVIEITYEFESCGVLTIIGSSQGFNLLNAN